LFTPTLPLLGGATPDWGARQTRAEAPVDGMTVAAMTAEAAAIMITLRMTRSSRPWLSIS
jgi:hypothetical protein